MTTVELSWIFLAVCAAATVAAGLVPCTVPLPVSLAVAAVLRVWFAGITSRRYTPNDVKIYFHHTATLVDRGRDPLHDLPGRQWNFLELMPYIHAVEEHSGLPWVYAVKIVPIAADLVLVWLVAQIAGADGNRRALQYAVNPLSLLVVSLHGQVEPVALAFALGGLLALRSGRPVLAGILLGTAVAAKTWPAVIVLALLPLRSPGRAVRLLVGAVIVPALCLLSGVLFLDTHPRADLHKMVSYSSYVSTWTWSGLLIQMGRKGVAGYTSSVSHLATVLIALGVLAVLVVLRRADRDAAALGALCAVLAMTAGFGPQYLLWVLPLAFALSGPVRLAYVLAATGWAGLFYLSPIASVSILNVYLRGLSWFPAALLVALAGEQLLTGARLPAGSAGARAATHNPPGAGGGFAGDDSADGGGVTLVAQ